MSGMFDGFTAWWAQPYTPTMSATKWFLFLGLILLLLSVWKVITYHLMEV